MNHIEKLRVQEWEQEAMVKLAITKSIEYLRQLNLKVYTTSVTQPRLDPYLETQTATRNAKIAELQTKMRFNNYLAFLKYEILIGFDTVGKVRQHIQTGVACPARIDLIFKSAGLNLQDFPDQYTVDELLKLEKIVSLSTNSQFLVQWQRYEFEPAKWSSYNKN